MVRERNTFVIKLGVWGGFFWFCLFVFLPPLRQMHEFIKYVVAVYQIPCRKFSQPWAKVLHFTRCLLSSAPLTFFSKISRHSLHLGKQTNKTIFLKAHKRQHYVVSPSGCGQVSQNNLPLTKDKAKILHLWLGDRAPSKPTCNSTVAALKY